MDMKLGDLVKCKITGFQGVVISYSEWINGCARVGVQPQGLDATGKKFDSDHFDILQLEVIKEQAVKSNLEYSKTIYIGDVAKDLVTGFEGVVTCSTVYIGGEEAHLLQPQELKEGKMVSAEQFAIGRLALVKNNVVDTKVKRVNKKKNTGGPAKDHLLKKN